ncbi:MAG: RDD family protein [Verrucomicrobiota bacterium]
MPRAKSNTLLIKTPEGISFSMLIASPVTRFLAYVIDLGCLSAATVLISSLLGFLHLLSFDLARAISILVFFVLQIGYGITAEWHWRGQTIGKRLLRLRVVDAQGLRLQFSQIVLRNLLRFVDMLPAFYLVGGITAFLNRRGQRLGDLAANTLVTRHPKIDEPKLDQLLAGKFNSLRHHPHLEARLRQRVSPSEATVALQSILRREEFEPAARIALFAEMADYFRSLVEFPPEAVEGITDEQYLRNVVDVLFRARSR